MTGEQRSLYRSIDGIQVFLEDDGRFSATVNGKSVTRGSLAALIRDVRKMASPVKVLVAPKHGYSLDMSPPRVEQVIGFHQSSSEPITLSGNKLSTWALEKAFLYDEDARFKLGDLYMRVSSAREEFDREYQDIIATLTPLSPEHLEATREPKQT